MREIWQHTIRVLLLGFIISFLGSLPLGTLNIAAMQIAISESISKAILFSFGSLAVEMIYVRISLEGISWISKNKKLMQALEYVSIGIAISLALFNFYSAEKMTAESATPTFIPWMNRFLLGVFMSAINPVQIPFWFGWSAILFERKLLQAIPYQYLWYIMGIGIGTLVGNCVFIFGGPLVAKAIGNNQKLIAQFIGSIFAITALIQVIMLVKKRRNAAIKD